MILWLNLNEILMESKISCLYIELYVVLAEIEIKMYKIFKWYLQTCMHTYITQWWQKSCIKFKFHYISTSKAPYHWFMLSRSEVFSVSSSCLLSSGWPETERREWEALDSPVSVSVDCVVLGAGTWCPSPGHTTHLSEPLNPSLWLVWSLQCWLLIGRWPVRATHHSHSPDRRS